MNYGTKIERSLYKDRRDGIGEVELASAGNVVLRVGREISSTPGPWEQIAHVVLTPEEWDSLAGRVSALRAAALIEQGERS
jgi:hypothetical protein